MATLGSHFCWMWGGVVCFHGSTVAFQLLQALMEGADALSEVKVHRGHSVLHQALKVQGDPLSIEVWGEGGRREEMRREEKGEEIEEEWKEGRGGKEGRGKREEGGGGGR